MLKLREEFKKHQESKFSGTELLFETSNEKYINWLEHMVVNKNDLLQRVRLALLPRKIVEAYKDYDKSCHCSHTTGEEPSYHYRNDIEWVIYRLKKALSNEA